MRTALLATVLVAIVTAHSAQAAEAEWQITPRAGFGDMEVDPLFRGPNDDRDDADTYTIGCALGLLTPIGIVAEIGADFGTEFDLFGSFDTYSIAQQFGAIGYQFELGGGWRFVPKFGRTHWSFRSDEGFLFNPGPEESKKVDGYDYYWEAGVSRRISQRVALGVNYKQGDYAFGRARSANFLVTIGLR